MFIRAEKGKQFPEIVKDLPDICGSESTISQITADNRHPHTYTTPDQNPFNGARAAFATVLHMHQPLVPSGGDDLKTAKLISNLQYMMEHQNIGDNHNAPVFQKCYERMGDFIPTLVDAGYSPRITLEYSGCLLFGLRQMGAHHVLEKLRRITCDPKYQRHVEWVGAPWGHAVAPSTPVQDFRHHVLAWQHHFAALFGTEALRRVRGFSPSEMALPNHPDVAFDFIKTLNEAGYQWVIVQEHTVECFEDGSPVRNPHIPHLLVATNSKGESASVIAIIKTQGSDTKLVGQMQPYYEAKSLDVNSSQFTIANRPIPPLVTQIADGENGGVMMNEFPPKYHQVIMESTSPSPTTSSQVLPMNPSEYLEHLFSLPSRSTSTPAPPITPSDLPRLRPIHQHRIFSALRTSKPSTPTDVETVIATLENSDPTFHMDGGSWTNNLSWIKGYENVLGPMEKLSARFQRHVAVAAIAEAEAVGEVEAGTAVGDAVATTRNPGIRLNGAKRAPTETETRKQHDCRNALYHLLCSQTSCYRYWGQGTWTDYGLEIIRRGNEIVTHDFCGGVEEAL